MLEWTPESLKAEIDYRHELARQRMHSARAAQELRGESWWSKLVHRHRVETLSSDPVDEDEEAELAA